jgi:hypothetical protein
MNRAVNEIGKDYYSLEHALTLNICIKSAGFFWNMPPSCALTRSAACNMIKNADTDCNYGNKQKT